jgi:hypothetical protein
MDDYYSLMTGLVLIRRKHSPNLGLDAQQREKACGYARGANAFRFGKTGQVDARAGVRRHCLEDLAPGLPVKVIRGHDRVAVFTPRPVLLP